VAIGYLMDKTGMTYAEVEAMLHRDSGILGLSGISSDERELEEAAAAGNARAQLALDVMSHHIIKYIGAYAFEMGGVDTIIFTGGIGENSDIMRALICKNLVAFGIRLDEGANVKFNRTEHEISTADSKVKLWVIPTNEELVIAQDTYRIVAGK
jgi:acetate kinase